MSSSLEVSLTKGFLHPVSKERSSSYKPRSTDLEQLQNTNKLTVNNEGIEETMAGLESIREGNSFY